MIRKVLALLLIVSLLSACSTSGGIYKKDDSQHGEFSMGKTILTVLGAIGTAALMKNNSGSKYDYNDYELSPSWTPEFADSTAVTTMDGSTVATRRQQLLTELQQTDESRTEDLARIRKQLADLDKQ